LTKETTREWLNQLNYGLGYFHHYRHLYSKSIDNMHSKVKEIYSDKTDLQIRSIELMLELELVNNAIMYCMDFASVFLSLQKPEKGIIKMISSIHETGSGSIKEFYEKINSNELSVDEIWNLMGYGKMAIKPKDRVRYNRSLNRFIEDLKRIASFFLNFYPIYSAYKHGMNIIPIYNEEYDRYAFQVGNPDGTFDYFQMSQTWFFISYEVIETLFMMFDKLVIPQISWILLKQKGVDLKSNDFKQIFKSTEDDDPLHPFRFTLNLIYPWKKFSPDKSNPFY